MSVKGNVAKKKAGGGADVSDKLTEPSSGLAVGKYFRIASIDANGHAVLECVDAPSAEAKTGSSAPTTSTVADYVGQHYHDTVTNKIYECTAITAQGTTPETYEYTWTLLAPVQSVSAGGTALTPDANGNVDVPKTLGDSTQYGLIRLQGSHRTGVHIITTAPQTSSYYGELNLTPFSEHYIQNRPGSGQTGYGAVTSNNVDTAVKRAMTDGIGAAWTDAERLAALLRMGCTVDENGYVKWTATPISNEE